MEDDLWTLAWAERPRLLAVARRRSRNRADAEEVVAEAVVRCCSSPKATPEGLPAMLTAVVMRLCVDRLRQRAVAERHAPRLFARPADAEEEVLDRAEAVWLSAEVARLSDRQRAALVANVLGLSVAETAEALGVSYKAAEGLLGRARGKVRAAWLRTLALLPLRRRPKAAAVVLAVAATATLGAWRAWHREPALPPVVEKAQVVGARAEPDWQRRRSQPMRPPARLAPERATASSPRPARLATPDLRVGPVRAHPSSVSLDLSDPVGRVERCVRDGVDIAVSASSVGVVCRE